MVHAEYRAYILEIINDKTEQTRTVRTTLPPQAYQQIYPLLPGEKIDIAQSWVCKGNTSHFRMPCSPEPSRPNKVQN